MSQTNTHFVRLAALGVICMACLSGVSAVPAAECDSCFAIRIIDQETGRGVPLVELKTGSSVTYYTDSRGLVAFCEPSLMNQQVAFLVSSDGYEGPIIDQDDSERGFVAHTTPGDSMVVKIHRTNIAERLYRVTGQDIYGASARLGYPIPIKHQGLNGKVCGQDTFIETVYKKKIYWFWGDTSGPAHFNGKASGATSELPGRGGLDPDAGIDLSYFVDSTGFSKPMCSIAGPGLIWIDWLATAIDSRGKERLFAKFSRTKSLGEDYERGIAVFDDSALEFRKVVSMDSWLDKVHSSGHPVRVRDGGRDYLYVADRYGLERVIADSQHITDAAAYEHFTCLRPGANFDTAAPAFERTAGGGLVYAWKPATDGIGAECQSQLQSDGKIAAGEGLWQMRDVVTGLPVVVRPQSLFWNNYRRCWIMLAYEFCGTIWYFEGDTPTGPWVYGRRIISHHNYDFYNAGQHPLFDQEDGRLIYFEGTYTTGFSGNKHPTPLYDYNQLMYRLSLDDLRLSLPAPVYRTAGPRGRESYLLRRDVDSLGLWKKCREIPFFAIPPERGTDQMIPIFRKADGKNCRFVTTSLGADSLPVAFFALPTDDTPASVVDPISGTWNCVGRLTNGYVDSARFELALTGQAVSGREVTRGVFRNGKLDLQIDAYGATLTGTLKEGMLQGELIDHDSGLKGTWTGRRVVGPPDKATSVAEAPLYEYQDKRTGAWTYTLSPDLESGTHARSPQPLCRVWINPYSVLLLDYTAKPVAITTE